MAKKSWMDRIKFDSHGLVPAIVQDAESGLVLMMAYMNRQAVRRTVLTGKAHFYSRSRKKLWLKGESSGHIQRVRSVSLDCDGDALLVQAEQVGGACHTGHRSCFYRKLIARKGWTVVGRPLFDPKKVYGK